MTSDDIITVDDVSVVVLRPAPYGPRGYPGSTVLNGSGPPDPDLGNDGDFYIDTLVDVMYGPKTAGVWGTGTSLVGPVGPAGPGSGNVIGTGPTVVGHVPKWNDISGTQLIEGYAVGTAANALVQMDATGKLPAVDASQLTHIAVSQLTDIGAITPGGRISLDNAQPTMIASYVNVGVINYMPDRHTFVPWFDGTNVVLRKLTAVLQQAVSDATKSPAALAANQIVDIFYWRDGSTDRATRGFPWISDIARGTGAGTAELDTTLGYPTNKFAITNGPAARQGTWLGCVRANASGLVDYILGGASAGGTLTVLGVYNAYNKRLAEGLSQLILQWTCNSATWRPFNNLLTHRSYVLLGSRDDFVEVESVIVGYNSNGIYTAIGLDSFTVPFSGGIVGMNSGNSAVQLVSKIKGFMGIGWHYFSPLEAVGGGVANLIGDGGGAPSGLVSGLFTRIWT